MSVFHRCSAVERRKMAPSSSGTTGIIPWTVLVLLLPIWLVSPSLAAGLTFAREPESELIENGRVRFMCEPKDELQKFVEVRWFRNEAELTARSKNVINVSNALLVEKSN
ncbi:contactin-5-like [Tropilaelaps mercedesae]|uniref:Contactin-5-like n=1 Tax=Tropilaelaps mercedesae TaxID=418985 RepID=A0A1V9X3L2_9ACAR|nr:contactin-5-like [Tropilaelaps mercedesae]